MGEEIKSLKTDTGSVQRNTTKISPLPFTDYAIDRYWPGVFEWGTADKPKDRIKKALNCKGALKGLKLVCFKKTKKKIFYLVYSRKINDKPTSVSWLTFFLHFIGKKLSEYA